MLSVWRDNSKISTFDSLKGNIKTDVLIIGGGMAGVLCAYMLDKAGVDYALVEAKNIGFGITQNTTAKITSQHGFIYNKIINEFDTEKAKQYLTANEKAVEFYRSMCSDIDCDFEVKDNYVYSFDKSKIDKELTALNKIGAKAEYVNDLPLPFNAAGAVKFKNQAQFNPLKFIAQISKNLNIYENTMVNRIEGNTAITDKGRIFAKRIIVATHFPFINKHGSYFLKMYQHRSYVLAVENAADVNGMYVDEDNKGMSFRNYKNLLFIGGGGHRTGKQGGGWDELVSFSNKYYPDSDVKYRWATQDCMTLDNICYIGNYSKNTPQLYVATGFNKWGMTSSMVSAMILTDIILGKENEFTSLYNPSRSILRPQLILNFFETAMNLLTPVPKRCTHLGCALKWNKQEHTWDCPCHGSRFTSKGAIIDNPAMKNLK